MKEAMLKRNQIEILEMKNIGVEIKNWMGALNIKFKNSWRENSDG